MSCVAEKMKVATFFGHQVGQSWSYRAVLFVPCSKSRDLGPGHGFRACSIKNKGKKFDFRILKKKKNEKQMEQNKKDDRTEAGFITPPSDFR